MGSERRKERALNHGTGTLMERNAPIMLYFQELGQYMMVYYYISIYLASIFCYFYPLQVLILIRV